MTYLAKNDGDKFFMGLPIEGEVGGWNRTPQEPLENLYVELKAAFDKGVAGIMWEQYTPSWNDGEPCEFSVRDPKVTTNKVVAQAWLEGSEPDMEVAYPDDDYEYDEYEYEQWSTHPDGKHVNDIVIPVDHAKYEDALRAKFGNNIKVIVTPNRVVTEDYDCGY